MSRGRALLLVALLGSAVAAAVLCAVGLLLPGLLAVVIGLAALAIAGRLARPANWTPEDRAPESR